MFVVHAFIIVMIILSVRTSFTSAANGANSKYLLCMRLYNRHDHPSSCAQVIYNDTVLNIIRKTKEIYSTMSQYYIDWSSFIA